MADENLPIQSNTDPVDNDVIEYSLDAGGGLQYNYYPDVKVLIRQPIDIELHREKMAGFAKERADIRNGVRDKQQEVSDIRSATATRLRNERKNMLTMTGEDQNIRNQIGQLEGDISKLNEDIKGYQKDLQDLPFQNNYGSLLEDLNDAQARIAMNEAIIAGGGDAPHVRTDLAQAKSDEKTARTALLPYYQERARLNGLINSANTSIGKKQKEINELTAFINGDVSAEEIDKALKGNTAYETAKQTVEQAKTDIEDVEKRQYNYMENEAYGETFDLSDIVASGEIKKSRDSNDTGRVDFWDINGDWMATIKSYDEIKISLGWKDASTARYKLTPLFEGIVTLRANRAAGNGASLTQIQATDKRFLMKQMSKTNVTLTINDSENITNKAANAGLDAEVEAKGLDRTVTTQYRTPDEEIMWNLIKGNGWTASTEISDITGAAVLRIVPQSVKDKMFVMEYAYNLMDIDISTSVPSEVEREQESEADPNSGDAGEPDPPPNEPPPDDDGEDEDAEDVPPDTERDSDGNPPLDPVEMGGGKGHSADGPTGETATLDYAAQLEAYNAAKEESIKKERTEISLTTILEPKITLNSLFVLNGYQPTLDGLYEVTSLTWQFGQKKATSVIQGRKLGKNELNKIVDMTKRHFETGRYIPPHNEGSHNAPLDAKLPGPVTNIVNTVIERYGHDSHFLGEVAPDAWIMG